MNAKDPAEDAERLRAAILKGYAQIAATGSPRRGQSRSCCSTGPITADSLTRHLGYSAGDLEALPENASMGLSCGNPAALAALQPGEVVLDLGAGGGLDVFVAGRKVGATGRAIGVDMTPEMLGKARKNIAHYRQETGLANVEFRLGEIE